MFLRKVHFSPVTGTDGYYSLQHRCWHSILNPAFTRFNDISLNKQVPVPSRILLQKKKNVT
jgi:hypothetical protein